MGPGMRALLHDAFAHELYYRLARQRSVRAAIALLSFSLLGTVLALFLLLSTEENPAVLVLFTLCCCFLSVDTAEPWYARARGYEALARHWTAHVGEMTEELHFSAWRPEHTEAWLKRQQALWSLDHAPCRYPGLWRLAERQTAWRAEHYATRSQ